MTPLFLKVIPYNDYTVPIHTMIIVIFGFPLLIISFLFLSTYCSFLPQSLEKLLAKSCVDLGSPTILGWILIYLAILIIILGIGKIIRTLKAHL